MPPAASPPPSLPSRWLLYCGLLSWKRPVVDERRSAGSHSRVAGVHVSALHINWDFCLLRKPCVEQFPRPSGNKKNPLQSSKGGMRLNSLRPAIPKTFASSGICQVAAAPSEGCFQNATHACCYIWSCCSLLSPFIHHFLPTDRNTSIEMEASAANAPRSHANLCYNQPKGSLIIHFYLR